MTTALLPESLLLDEARRDHKRRAREALRVARENAIRDVCGAMAASAMTTAMFHPDPAQSAEAFGDYLRWTYEQIMVGLR